MEKQPKNSSLPIYYYISSYYVKLLEINPGPKSNTLNRYFSICNWNLNSISEHMFTKISFLSAYIFVHKIICLSETYLNSEILSDDKNLEKPGYNLVREDITNLTVNVVESVFAIEARSHLE